jgi:hypothetical protein
MCRLEISEQDLKETLDWLAERHGHDIGERHIAQFHL